MTDYNTAITARIEAEKRNEATEKFLRSINHEVRTSIHAITNALSTLKTDLHSFLQHHEENEHGHTNKQVSVKSMEQQNLLPITHTITGSPSSTGARMLRWMNGDDEESKSSPRSTLRSLSLLIKAFLVWNYS